jgi:hypothetical protein
VPRLDRFPYQYRKEPWEYQNFSNRKATLPDFADPMKAFKGFVGEIVQTVYETHRDLWVDTPTEISNFLNCDFFGTGCTPRDARLSKLHVSGLLDPGARNSINLSTLTADFAPLLTTIWAQKFELDIVFRTELGISHFRTSLPELAEIVHTVCSAMNPIIADAEKRGAKVNFSLLTKETRYEYVGGDWTGMCESEEQWLQELKVALGGLKWGSKLPFPNTDPVVRRDRTRRRKKKQSTARYCASYCWFGVLMCCGCCCGVWEDIFT